MKQYQITIEVDETQLKQTYFDPAKNLTDFLRTHLELSPKNIKVIYEEKLGFS